MPRRGPFEWVDLPGAFFALEVDEQDGEVAGGDAFETAGLADGLGAEFFEGLAGFFAEFEDGGEVEAIGDGFVFEVAEAAGHFFFALDVAGVFGFDFDLGEGGGEGGICEKGGLIGAHLLAEDLEGDVGAAEEFVSGGAAGADGEFGGFEDVGDTGHGGEFLGEAVAAVR